VQDDVIDEFILPDCQISRASCFIHGHLKLLVRCQPFVKSIPGTSSILELLTPRAVLPLCRNRMTKKSRNWLMVLLSIPVRAVLKDPVSGTNLVLMQ
jgi:hypothetical protein